MLYIIITASINERMRFLNRFHKMNSEMHRKNRYLDSISHLLNLLNQRQTRNVKVVIVENNGYRKTYLDDLLYENGVECNILYTNNNDIRFGHKGGNELADIKCAIEHFNIEPDDMIIKITGRYKLLDLSFVELVERSIQCNEGYDAFVKFYNVCEMKFMENDCVLGLFAIKCRLLKEFDYKYMKSPECEFAEYVRARNNFLEIEHLNLECCFSANLKILIV